MSNFNFIEPWHAMFPQAGGHVVAFYGSGGKTSMMSAVASVYREAGRPCVATTTTRTEALDWPALRVGTCGATDGSGSDIPEPAGGEILFLRSETVPGGKWLGLEPEAVDRLADRWPDAVVLVEADGSAGKPLKFHRADEPVWPTRTSMAVIVMGLGSVGEAPASVVHRHGRLEAPKGLESAEAVDWDFLFTLLTGPGGYLSRLPDSVPPVLVLTQVDLCEDSIGLFEWLGRVMEIDALPLVLLCSLDEQVREIRAVCRRRDEGGPA